MTRGSGPDATAVVPRVQCGRGRSERGETGCKVDEIGVVPLDADPLVAAEVLTPEPEPGVPREAAGVVASTGRVRWRALVQLGVENRARQL